LAPGGEVHPTGIKKETQLQTDGPKMGRTEGQDNELAIAVKRREVQTEAGKQNNELFER